MSTSYLNGAHNLNIQNLNITHQVVVASKAFDHLYDNVATDAMHDSNERCDAPKCHEDTRRAVQQEIHSWITNGDDDAEPKKIMWMTGPAGAGKTAIAGSIAEVCDDERILAGSFFFSLFAGSDTRRTKRCLITTLAYRLLQHEGLQQLRAPILSAIQRDPSILRKSLSAQLKVLILKPLRDVRQLLILSDLPKVIIIDGLDEVEAADSRQLGAREARLANEAEQVEILSTLLQAAHNSDFPFRILVVSRPEPVIRDFFSHRAKPITREMFLDDKYNPDSDIALFLKAKFSEIRRRYRLPISWPGEEALDLLRDRASGQFIYAATVVRFLQTAGMHPQARLERVLHAASAHASGCATVFLSLDALYIQILNSSPDPILSTRWIGVMRHTGLPALFVRQLLQDFHGQADFLLENLASLIRTPLIEEIYSRFELYHKSLEDFLRDSQRCGPELYEAFQYGADSFVSERLLGILKANSPAVPLAESEWPDFLGRVLPLIRFHGVLHSSPEGDLISCDILWWVRRMDHIFRDCEDRGRDSMVYLFYAVHEPCPRGICQGPDDCRLVCKRWRSDIISACKALGWCVPNAIALLRERMQEAAHLAWRGDVEAQRLLHSSFNKETFYPPIGDADIPSTASTNLPHGDYESMCCLADSLYSRLPPDWIELYKMAVMEGKTPYNALRLEIGRIMDELGVEIEDNGPGE